jgi:hypothetical protein
VVLQWSYSGVAIVTFADLNTLSRAFSRKGTSQEWCSGHVSVSTLDLAKASVVMVVFVVLQLCYRVVTVLLQRCHSTVTVMLHSFPICVAVVLQW